ncbi:MAG: 3-hydroxy-3-methylglutaryl-CoA lyase, partial [Lachnospiraceae bacterium]|nr:3-hydroxy-3-methylglutaryl-CoA lyase [Lachnospiraceae bacterium]
TEKKIKRNLLLDGSLYGMGKGAGNTPIELLAMYMRENLGGKYHLSQLLEAVDVTIMDCYRETPWGYGLKFFIAASNDCHPNYVAALMEKKKLSVKSINEILENIPKEKKLLYDSGLIEELYETYQTIACDDSDDLKQLTDKLSGRDILLIGPGKKGNDISKVNNYCEEKSPVSISVNFIPEGFETDYVFMSNAKRYVKLAGRLADTLQKNGKLQTIATSNVTRAQGRFDYVLAYGNLLDEDALIKDNPLFMLLKLCKLAECKSIALAGFDGYEKCIDTNYVNPNMEYTFSKEKAEVLNEDTAEGIKRAEIKCPICFVTESLYERLLF